MICKIINPSLIRTSVDVLSVPAPEINRLNLRQVSD